MPSITLTLPTSGTVITAGLHANNYTSLQTLLNGGLDDSNIAAGGISFSKLAAAAWTAYTPAWTSSGVAPVLGNGTLTGRYAQIGKTIVGRVNLTMGSTTTFGTGNYSFSLPVTANAGEAAAGTALGGHAGTYGGIIILSSTTTVSAITLAAPGVTWGQLVPVTWVSTDGIFAKFTYEAA